MSFAWTHNAVRYGLDMQERGWIWENTNNPGTNRPAILYFPGGGWSRTHYSLAESLYYFLTVTGADTLASTEQAAVNGFFEANDDIVFMSCDYPMSVHNSASANGRDDQYWADRPPSGHYFLSHSIRAVHDAVAWMRAYGPSLYNVDPNKIIVAGSSAGGQLVSGAAYGRGEGFTTSYNRGSARAAQNQVSSLPDAMILHQAPTDLSIVPGGIYAPHSGIEEVDYSSDLDLIERTKMTSAIKLFQESDRNIPVFSWYDTIHDADFVPSGSGGLSGAHSPYWGVLLHELIEARGGVNHKLYVFDEAEPGDLAASTSGSYASLYNPEGFDGTSNGQTGASAPWPTANLRTWMTDIGFL